MCNCEVGVEVRTQEIHVSKACDGDSSLTMLTRLIIAMITHAQCIVTGIVTITDCTKVLTGSKVLSVTLSSSRV